MSKYGKVLLKVEKKLNEALDVAIKEGYPDVVEELIKGGADINYVNENKDTPLLKLYSMPVLLQNLVHKHRRDMTLAGPRDERLYKLS